MINIEGAIASSQALDSDSEDIHSVVSSTAPSNKDINQASTQNNENQLARNETKTISYLRFFVFGLLLVTAVLVSVGVYLLSRRDQEQDFEAQFEAQAIRILERFHHAVEGKLGALDAMATSITSLALSTGATFPNVTIPHMELRGANTRILADGLLIYYTPLVTNENRKGWEAYATENHGLFMQSFLAESELRARQDAAFGIDNDERRQLSAQQEEALEAIRNPNRQLQDDPSSFNPVIWGVHDDADTDPVMPEGSGPFLPIWQMSPVLPLEYLLNLDLLTFPLVSKGYQSAIDSGEAVIDAATSLKDDGSADVFNEFLALGQYRHDKEGFQGDPLSPTTYPVFDSFGEDRKVAALLATNIYWRLYFTDVLPPGVVGIICVLENTANQTFSFQVDGPEVTYLGNRDYHDPRYSNMGQGEDVTGYVLDQASPENRAYTTVNLNGDSTSYKLRVYPSQTFEDEYVNSKPIVYTFVVALIFVFTSSVFVVYDCLVERRQTIVLDRAVRSSAVVSSLFPKNVRERLYKDQQVEKEKNLRKANNSGNEWKSVEGLEKKLSDTNQSNETSKSMPIADEFLETTVMFADLAGFTKWSSNRKPQEVFHLLETFYGAFDAIAMKRKVFKVETIGDCYLAVTGLPEPQPDHAVIMAKFARDCMLKMKQLTRELEQSMGPDVLELEFRVGLNSGPVTAGVLRGDKSRFQLFGDTVNTAARMESNGIKGRIHCSQATADQMIKVGKSHWLKPREGGVQVKGKGRLDTYFLNPVVAMSQTVATSVHPGEGDVDML